VLAIPFLVGIAALRGLTVALPIFHGSDEAVYQYPTILRFSHELPFPNLHIYGAAQTPLFHLVMAYAGKLIGFELWRLRLLEAVISYLLALAVFRLLHSRFGIERRPALALALLFSLSPYVFGYAFRLMTDNLALLFSVLALDRFERSRQAGRTGPFLVGCLCSSAAVLTRQSTAFLFGLALLYAWAPRPPRPPAQRLLASALVALATVPVGLLFLNWHGLVPPGGDSSSCGLCTGRAGSSGLEVPTTELTLAVVGLYGALLFAPLALARVRSRRPPLTAAAVAAALLGGVLLAVIPAAGGAHAAGALWSAARKLPTIGDTSLLFWVLVPLGAAVLWLRIRGSPRPWALSAFAVCFLISTLVIRFPWQKYVDPFALLILLLTVRRGELTSARRLLGAAVLAAAFIAYAADYSAHANRRLADRTAPAAARNTA
jgi:4-amino-4-deoxy-L-arabinose transferase-like glycosyltransferase